MRNPVGNGSAPVIRAAVFNDIGFLNRDRDEIDYFDESFRQSEDIECWCRIALSTKWRFEGIAGQLTRYRINEGGLSANVVRQFTTWLRVKEVVKQMNPGFARRWAPVAEAYQLRYLARRCIRMGEGAMAWSLIKDALKACPKIVRQEPGKTLTTLLAAGVLRFLPAPMNAPLQAMMMRR